MKSRRHNWIVLLVGSLLMFAIGAAGIHAGAGIGTTMWFALGVGFLVASIVVLRMRLP